MNNTNNKHGAPRGGQKPPKFPPPTPPLKLLLSNVADLTLPSVTSLLSHINSTHTPPLLHLHTTNSCVYATVSLPVSPPPSDYVSKLQKWFNGYAGNKSGIIKVEKCWDQKSYDQTRSGNRTKTSKYDKLNNTIHDDSDFHDFESRLSSDGQSLSRSTTVVSTVPDVKSSLVTYLKSRVGDIDKQERRREAREKSRTEIRRAKGVGGKKKGKKKKREGREGGDKQKRREKKKGIKVDSKEFPSLV
ncbi:hypothetical protein TrVE_jg1607 [Triparma verrucosa]|uniref:Uncharacterized protein n=1 Tax=Triparma verrucosa TaxID=1606542 RepID=A0A9W7BVZ2_9STRA|nr:hypothetical protein TrVE_jg1607 [Triparma verrucosa]